MLLLSFGSALSLSIWMLRRCPICFQFLLAALFCCVCSRVLLLLLQVGFRILHSSHSSRVLIVLRCILSGWNKDKTSQGKGFCGCSLVRCLMYLPFQVWRFGALAAASFWLFNQVNSLPAAACEAFSRLFTSVIYGFSNWLGTPGGRVASARVHITCSATSKGVPLLCLQWPSWFASPLVVDRLFWLFSGRTLGMF